MIGCFDEGGPTQPRTKHMIIFGLKLVSANDTLFEYFDLQSKGVLELSVNESIVEISPLFIEPDSSIFPYNDISMDHHLEFQKVSANISLSQEEGEKWKFNLKGLSAGSASFDLKLMHIDHSDFSATIPVKVHP